jgi:hypothetical protein
MIDLRSALAAAERPALLRYLARSINGFTVMARDPDASEATKAAINNRIHYLSGHLVGLTHPAEPLTQSRLDGILENVASLNRGLADQIEAELIRQRQQ